MCIKDEDRTDKLQVLQVEGKRRSIHKIFKADYFIFHDNSSEVTRKDVRTVI